MNGVIQIEHVYKSFGKKEVLVDLNLEIHKGEILVILGKSGIGKSVLLGLIMGMKHPDSGKITVDNVCITSMTEKERYNHPIIHKMGILFQGGALLDSLTVEENVGFYLKEHGDPENGKRMNEQQIKERVKQSLELVGLHSVTELMSSELSGGMRKRVALARLIAYNPDFIFYDEPTSELDLVTSYQISQLIAKTNSQIHGTSIVVSHDLNLALSIGHRLALLDEGKIQHIAPPKEFIQIDHPIINSLRNAMIEGCRNIEGGLTK